MTIHDAKVAAILGFIDQRCNGAFWNEPGNGGRVAAVRSCAADICSNEEHSIDQRIEAIEEAAKYDFITNSEARILRLAVAGE